MKVFNYISEDNRFYQFNIKKLDHGSIVAIMIENNIQLAEVQRVWENEDMYYATVQILNIDINELKYTKEMINLAQPKQEYQVL